MTSCACLYLETMEEILRRNPKVVIDDRVQGLVPFLQLNEPGRPSASAGGGASQPRATTGPAAATVAPTFPASRPNAGLAR